APPSRGLPTAAPTSRQTKSRPQGNPDPPKPNQSSSIPSQPSRKKVFCRTKSTTRGGRKRCEKRSTGEKRFPDHEAIPKDSQFLGSAFESRAFGLKAHKRRFPAAQSIHNFRPHGGFLFIGLFPPVTDEFLGLKNPPNVPRRRLSFAFYTPQRI